MKNREAKDTLGNNLRMLMWDNRINRKDVAGVLGLTPATISNFTHGRTPINSEHLAKLSEVYGVSVDWLLTGEGAMYLDERTAA